MTLQLHRPDGTGELKPRPVPERDWRTQLRSRRWGSALRGGLPIARNTEMAPTSIGRSIALWAFLGVSTFAAIVVGYGTGFWT